MNKIQKVYLYFFKYIFYIFLIIIFTLIYILYKNKYNKIKNMKVCICTVGKNENLYIREFIEHYKKYGIDKIFLYDNNNIEGEKFEDIIMDFINEGFIEIKNWRGIRNPQIKIYHDCYKRNYNIFDWLIFNDIDEFIHLKKKSIKFYLSNTKFKKCDKIYLNWVLHTDNNLIFYENKSLAERFTEIYKNIYDKRFHENNSGKTILRGHIPNITITNVHSISNKLKFCDGFGRKIKSSKPDLKYFYFDHYYSKSIEEFIDKIKKGDVNNISNSYKIRRFFFFNKITYEKIDYLERKLNIKLLNFRKRIKFK